MLVLRPVFARISRANAYIFSEYNTCVNCKNPVQVKSGAVKSYNDTFTSCTADQQQTVVANKAQTVSTIPSNRYPTAAVALPCNKSLNNTVFTATSGSFDNMIVNVGKIASDYTDHHGKPKSQRVAGSEFFARSDSGNIIYGVKVTGMSMGDYDQVVTVSVYKADGTHVYTIKDSMGSYLRRMCDKNNDDSLYRETATAMAMAHACLHRNDK